MVGRKLAKFTFAQRKISRITNENIDTDSVRMRKKCEMLKASRLAPGEILCLFLCARIARLFEQCLTFGECKNNNIN